MRVEETVHGPVRVLRTAGTIDLPASALLQDALLAAIDREGAKPPLIVVEMSGVPFISSAGLRALLIASKRARETKGKLAVAALTPDVGEIFRIARFDLVVSVFGEAREAIEWMSPEAAASWDGG